MSAPAPQTKPAAKPAVTPARGAFAAVLTIGIAAGVIKPWEGLEVEPYFDIVGVATVCYGETRPDLVRPGSRYTEEECSRLLGHRLAGDFAPGLERCISPAARMTPLQQAVVLSWSYNVGTQAACSSTLVRQLNAGQPASVWCDQLLRWDRAGGKQVRGLTRRRQHEHQLCERGI